MPRFFIPAAESPTDAEQAWKGIRDFAMETCGRTVSDRRIYQLRYTHDGNTYEAKVDEQDPREREPIICILDAGDMYLVCTPNRGVVRGIPMLVGKRSVLDVVDFD